MNTKDLIFTLLERACWDCGGDGGAALVTPYPKEWADAYENWSNRARYSETEFYFKRKDYSDRDIIFEDNQEAIIFIDKVPNLVDSIIIQYSHKP